MRLLVARLPIDPDLAPATERPLPVGRSALVVSAGGVLGALARFAVASEFPHRADRMPWATFGVNATGCFLLAVLLVLLSERMPGLRYARPFLGAGMLGGFTTFSTLAVDAIGLWRSGSPTLSGAYVGLSVVTMIGAVLAALVLTRAALRLGNRRRWYRRVAHARRLARGKERTP